MGHIFISYSHKNNDYAHKLAEMLQRQGFEVWIDARIDYGAQWSQEIQKQLDNCSAFIVIMSPPAFESEWVQSELSRAMRKDKPIFPLLFEGDEPWLSVESTQFYDVRGGILPDDRFYRTLWQVVQPANTGQTLKATPPDLRGQSNDKKSLSPALIAGGIVGVGLVCLAFIAVAFIFMKANPWAAVPPSQTAQVTTPAPIAAITDTPKPPTALTPPTRTNTPFKIRPITPTFAKSITPTRSPTPSPTLLPRVPMVLVPAGEFMMGSNDGAPDEKPVHRVSLNAFYIDKYEVSNYNYKACVDARICIPPSNTSSYTRAKYYGNPDYYNYPVIYATWEMAKTYCEWRGARLPTEPEWEKAARGTKGNPYPWGSTFRGNYLNFCDKQCPFEHANLTYDDGYADTSPVDAFPQGASPYGVFNMSGNVFEWTSDWYNVYPGGDPAASNQFGQNARVRRSGAWFDDIFHIRPALRIGHGGMTNWLDLTGIRCAKNAK